MKNRAYRFQLLVVLLLFITSFFGTGHPIPVSAAGSSPKTVTIAGTLQSELGCSADWMPDCLKTALTYDIEDDIWQGAFQVTPANDQDKKGPRYKAAIDGTWDINYGLNATSGGSDIPLVVSKSTLVKFYYDDKTHWVTDNFNTPILVALGDFQTQLGCRKNSDAGCLRSWLEDPSGSGTFSFVTRSLKKGSYTISLAKNEDPQNIVNPAQPFSVNSDNDEIYFGYDPMNNQFTISTSGAPKGSLGKQKANWVDQDTILWNVAGSPKYSYSLFYSLDATLQLTSQGMTGGIEIALTYDKAGPGAAILKSNPYLSGYTAFKIPSTDLDKVHQAVKGQLAVVARDDQGNLVDATGVQIPGVLDSLFNYEGPLGVTFDSGVPTLRLWAPTAKSVSLHLYADSSTQSGQTLPMTPDEKTGVWSLTGSPAWNGSYYLYEVTVFVPSTGKFEDNVVTDPYSFSLSTNSARSQIVNLADPSLKPSGWDSLAKPALAAPEDIVLYELHIRDFSANDPTVPENLRGTYEAFTVSNSNGMKHLAALAQAGLTHIHLLPSFDFATINEDKSTWQNVDGSQLAAYPPDSDKQWAAVSTIKSVDGFNWGYDPYHYTVPEGSYATDPNGFARIREFRDMVTSLNHAGLRVVMDVVYNHTSDSGQSPRSVLDKIVPGYYYRLDTDGKVERGTCCEDTATEHAMMEKLMVDSVVTWATAYKVDGFRFDLMGFHMLDDMKKVRSALDGLTVGKNGVDGKSIYIYGEGWDFGEVANNARGVNATQQNIGGTGIGVFNDRLRDGVRGGNPFSDPRTQGFSTGLFTDPNAAEVRDPGSQEAQLLEYMDWIRLGLAGNQRDYKLTRADGTVVDGQHILYNGSPAGYTLDPQENVIYVSAHDNSTLFDAIQLKAPASASLADRIRMNNLALSLPMFSQGVPFFHAGDDILRSKSLDNNSYDSGDWFNKLDWTLSSNNWGVGLPGQPSGQWDLFRPLLANPQLKPDLASISGAASIFQEFLRVRKSSPLFRLQTADQVERSLTFLNAGPDQIPGLIVMRLTNVDNLDPNYGELVVLFNADKNPVTFADGSFAGKSYFLHPVQQNSVDPLVRTSTFENVNSAFTVPGRTTAVFVLKQTAQPTAQSVSQPTAAISLTAAPTTLATAVPISASSGHSSWLVFLAIGLLIVVVVVILIIVSRNKRSA